MTALQLSEIFGFEVLAMPEPEHPINGCYIGDLLSWVMGRAQADNVWITIMSNINIAAVAALADVGLVILAEDVLPDNSVIQTAEAKGINLVRTKMTAYETAVKLAQHI